MDHCAFRDISADFMTLLPPFHLSSSLCLLGSEREFCCEDQEDGRNESMGSMSLILCFLRNMKNTHPGLVKEALSVFLYSLTAHLL